MWENLELRTKSCVSYVLLSVISEKESVCVCGFIANTPCEGETER